MTQEQGIGLQATIQEFMPLITQDPGIESAWLSALSHMEELASQQILGNISGRTPEAARAEIIAHADDEMRHCRLIEAMRPIPAFTDARYLKLEKKLREIAGSFVTGYFGNPLLVTARDRHTAYVHGAITIEQFPFQIYSTYLKHTRLPSVLESLPTVLADEEGHISLGKKLLTDVPEEKRLSLARLHEIERDMCKKMIRRMHRVVSEFQNEAATADSDPVRTILGDEEARVGWIHALGHAEAVAALHMQRIFSDRGIPQPDRMAAHVEDEMRHCRLLQRSVLLERRKLMKRPGYQAKEKRMLNAVEIYLLGLFSSILKKVEAPEQIYLYGAHALESRVFRHYADVIKESDQIGVAHVIGTILQDEAAHLSDASAGLKAAGCLSQETFKEIQEIEKGLYERMVTRVAALVTRAQEARAS